LIAAEDVLNGKPAPDCYRLAAQRLRVDPRTCLVFEDAGPGIAAAEAAGASVVVIGAGQALETSHAKLANYRRTKVVADREGLTLVEAEPIS
jgi:sugar-phosphatase